MTNQISINLPQPANRIIHLAKQVDQDSINAVVASILEIQESDDTLKELYTVAGFTYNPKPIKLYIDSYGGYVYQCLGLVNIMRASKTPIHTIVTGVAASCGFVIAVSGHKRYCYPLSSLLYHQVSTGGQHTNLKELDESLNQAKKLQKTIEQIVIERTTITKARLKEVYNTKFDWWVNPKEALKLNIVDEIIGG